MSAIHDPPGEQLGVAAMLQTVLGAICAVGALLPAVLVLIGLLIAVFTAQARGLLVGGVFVAIAATSLVTMGVMAAALFYTAALLNRRENHVLCLIVSIVELWFFPLGTAVGVHTLYVLLQPGVKAAFARAQPAHSG